MKALHVDCSVRSSLHPVTLFRTPECIRQRALVGVLSNALFNTPHNMLQSFKPAI